METIAIAVMSLDGCLTRHDTAGPGFASEADQAFFQQAMATFDCALMGGASYRAAREHILANPRAGHLRRVVTRSPEQYRADSKEGALEFCAAEPAAAVRGLAARGFKRCAVVGGPRLITGALEAGLLDQLWVTIEPLAFGHGVRLLEGRVDFRFTLMGSEALGPDTLLVRYRPLPAR
jgi:riboflavin biosynthesis pyrimidine reductase